MTKRNLMTKGGLLKHAKCVQKRQRRARAQWSDTLFGVRARAQWSRVREHEHKKNAAKRTRKREATEFWSTVREVLVKGRSLPRRITYARLDHVTEPSRSRLETGRDKTVCLDPGEDLLFGGVDEPSVDSERIYEAEGDLLLQPSKTVCLAPSEAPVLTPWPGKAPSLLPGEDVSLQTTEALESKILQLTKVLESRSNESFPFHLVQYTNRDGSTHEVIQRVQHLKIFAFPTSKAPGRGAIVEKGHILKFQFIGGEGDEHFHCQDENDSLFFLAPQMQHDHLHGFSMTLSLCFSEMPRLKAVFQFHSTKSPDGTFAVWLKQRGWGAGKESHKGIEVRRGKATENEVLF